MKLDIRIAISADLPTLNDLYAQMDGESELPPETVETLFGQIRDIPDYRIYIAESEGEAVGTFSLLIAPTFMHRGFHKFAVLDAVTVTPDFRGRGIGREMMKEAIALAAAAGCYKVTLSSNVKRDRAHAFYRSLGFEQHGWSFSLKTVPEQPDLTVT
ncbi:MAG: GNAT family N-acetyltransferase [Limnospira sp.]